MTITVASLCCWYLCAIHTAHNIRYISQFFNNHLHLRSCIISVMFDCGRAYKLIIAAETPVIYRVADGWLMPCKSPTSFCIQPVAWKRSAVSTWVATVSGQAPANCEQQSWRQPGWMVYCRLAWAYWVSLTKYYEWNEYTTLQND